MAIRKKLLSIGRAIRTRLLYGPHERLAAQWRAERGDITTRITYDFLTEDSVVFDLGGYRGQWASDIYAKYGCTVYVFEPVPEYADFIRGRFKKNKKIKIYGFGLGATDGERPIRVAEEGSSVYLRGADMRVPFKDIVSFLVREKIKEIDLMKLNIEGGEYEVLPRLISSGYISHLRALQIQFHDFVPDAPERVRAIRRDLEKTHRCDYRYDFIWEGWSRGHL